LIQRALDTEEGNIKEHRNYLKAEEEKRNKARVIKMPTVTGPLLRWISKIEVEKFKVQVEVTPPQPQPTAIPAYGQYTAAQVNSYYAQLYQYLASHSRALSAMTAQVGSSSTSAGAEQTSTSQLPTVSGAPFFISTPSVESASGALATASSVGTSAVMLAAPSVTITAPSTAPSSTTFSFRFQNATPCPSIYHSQAPTTAALKTATSAVQPTFFTSTETTAKAQPSQKQYVEEERAEKATKNYVVVEADQRDGIAKPPWKDLMKAMFGDHVKWDELKVLSGKGRPSSKCTSQRS